MLSLPKTKRVFVAAEPCDMRKQFDGLAALARDGLGATRAVGTSSSSATGAETS